jgi:hypothetical protein
VSRPDGADVPHRDAVRSGPPVAPGSLADRLRQICNKAAEALSAVGVGVSVMTADGAHGIAAASDPATARIEELQFTFGEGPCIEAFAASHPLLIPDLDATTVRWPVYTPAVADAGVRAVFAFPLQVGAARLGVLDVFRDRVGSLSRVELGEAFTYADRAVNALLDGQEGTAGALDETFAHGAELFQAQGMVMVQLGVSLAEALVRIRAYAFATSRPLSEVAVDIVARRLRLERDTSEDTA